MAMPTILVVDLESSDFGCGQKQDFEITFPGPLDSGIAGHVRMYLLRSNPNPEREASC